MNESAMRLLAAALWLLGAPIAAFAALRLRLNGHRYTIGHALCAGRHGSPIHVRRVKTVSGSGGAGLLQSWLSLLDVAAGRLAFVGPRPRALDSEIAPHLQRSVLSVKPGIVSLWTVRSRARIDYDSEEEMDREYVAGRSLRGDLGILLRGALAAMHGSAAQRVPIATEYFGVRHLNIALNEVVDLLAVVLRGDRRARVAFVNPDCVNLAQRDPIYRAVLGRFDWVLTDGVGMRIAGRLLRQPVRQNVNGTDLFPRLCELLEASGDSLYLLGGRPGVTEGVVDWIRARHPGLRIAGHHHGYFAPHEEAGVVGQIRASGAAVLLVGFGAPRQERWIAAHANACGVMLSIGVGGLFDYYSGRIPRAPQWLRELGGEWIYRLVQEPGRLWKRYLIGNVVFLLRVLRARAAPLKGVARESQ